MLFRARGWDLQKACKRNKKGKRRQGSEAGSKEIRENKGEKVQPGQRSVFPGLHHRRSRDDWYCPCIANLLGKHRREFALGNAESEPKAGMISFQGTKARLEEMQEGGREVRAPHTGYR